MNKKQKVILILMAVLLLAINTHYYFKYKAINFPDVAIDGYYLIYLIEDQGSKLNVEPIYFKVLFIDFTLITVGVLLFFTFKDKNGK